MNDKAKRVQIRSAKRRVSIRNWTKVDQQYEAARRLIRQREKKLVQLELGTAVYSVPYGVAAYVIELHQENYALSTRIRQDQRIVSQHIERPIPRIK